MEKINYNTDLTLGKWILRFPSTLKRFIIGNNTSVIDLTNQFTSTVGEFFINDKFQDINFSGYIIELPFMPKDIDYVTENGQILAEDLDYIVDNNTIEFIYPKINKIIIVKYKR